MPVRRTLYVCDGRCGLTCCRILARVATRALELGFGQTSQDGKTRLSTLRCRERAGCTPMVMVDDDSHMIGHPAELRELIADLRLPAY